HSLNTLPPRTHPTSHLSSHAPPTTDIYTLSLLDALPILGVRTVIAHSTADARSLPVRLADESICVGPNDARSSYLNIPSIISAAAVTDSEAIHPGYGFLAENPAFADICRPCGITSIGPPA